MSSSSLSDRERRQLQVVWSALDAAADDRAVEPGTDEAWAALRSTIEMNGAEKTDRPSVQQQRAAAGRSSLRRIGFIAPALAAAVALTLALTWFYGDVTVSVPRGEQSAVVLPDGSVVGLNSASSLRYSRGFRAFPFGSRRHVNLAGEAFFEVASTGESFSVETPDARIEVVGTKFNVRSRAGLSEAGTVVTLAEGSVRVAGRRGTDDSVVLEDAGAEAAVSAEGGVRTAVRPSRLDRVLAWRRQGFAVVDLPLDAVLDEVERRYAVEIVPRDGIDLADPMNLFYLRGASPDQILRDICLAQGCVFRETSRGFALFPPDGTDRSVEPLRPAPEGRPAS